MLRLGQQVLKEIQGIIIEIDRPKSLKKQANRVLEERSWDYEMENEDDYPNRKLYDHAKLVQIKSKERQRQRVYKELSELKDFKVTNKHSLFLNSQVKKRPIHERIQEIIGQKEGYLMQKRMERLKQKEKQQEKEYNQFKKYQEMRNQNRKNPQQVQKMVEGLEKKQKQRLHRINMRKVQQLRKSALEQSQKPKINNKSKKLYRKQQIKRSLSTNVLERFEQYSWQKKRRDEQYLQDLRDRETPFTPKINNNSRILADNVSRSPLTRDLERSTSCKCFKKLDKNSRHLKSTSTYVNTSRYQMSNDGKCSRKYLPNPHYCDKQHVQTQLIF